MSCAKPFLELTAAGQFRRLRRLAERAIERYPLTVHSLHAIHHGENTTFRLEATDARGRAGRYLVRVCRPDYQTAATLRGELDWLDALRAQTDIVAPHAVAGLDGHRVQTVEVDGVPEARRVVLFEWVEGRRKTSGHIYPTLRRSGRLLARLHDHTAGWTRPEGFARPPHDAASLFGLGELDKTWNPLEVHGEAIEAVQAGALEQLLEARAHILEELEVLGMPADRSGLIHADMHMWNVVFAPSPRTGELEARPIDFDDAGFGHHVYDIAVALGHTVTRDDHAACIEAFVAGYREVRDLGDDLLAYLPTWLIARNIAMTSWIFDRSDNPELKAWQPKVVVRTLTRYATYLEGSPAPQLRAA